MLNDKGFTAVGHAKILSLNNYVSKFRHNEVRNLVLLIKNNLGYRTDVALLVSRVLPKHAFLVLISSLC